MEKYFRRKEDYSRKPKKVESDNGNVSVEVGHTFDCVGIESRKENIGVEVDVLTHYDWDSAKTPDGAIRRITTYTSGMIKNIPISTVYVNNEGEIISQRGEVVKGLEKVIG